MNNNSAFILKAVGDICPGDKSILGLGICSLMKKYGADFPLRNVQGMFDEADIVIGNLEGLLSAHMKGKNSSDINFCGLPEFACELKKTGFNVINVANNHILEHGNVFFQETVDILQKSGLQVCGLRDHGLYYSKPVFVEKDRKKAGIIGYNWVGKDKFPGANNYIAQSHDSVVNYTWERNSLRDQEFQGNADKKNQNVINDIRRLKNEVDYVILMPHWGYEFVNYPPYGVTLEARTFIDAGADLILGVHPHVVQGMEQYKGKWVFYSLGNFLFDMRYSSTKNSVLLDFTFVNRHKSSFEINCLRLNSSFQPTKATEKEDTKIRDIIQKSTKIIAHDHTAITDDIMYKKFENAYRKAKLNTIYNHLIVLPLNPSIFKLILKKSFYFITLLIMRLFGNKVRW